MDFGKFFKKSLEKAENISIYLDTNVVHLEKNSNMVQSARIKSLNNNEFTIKAKIFILAAGGIENPRLLLVSNVGNEHDQVGRYYMDHPKGKAGILTAYESVKIPSWTGFRLTDNIQRELRILNSQIFLEVLPELSITARIKRKLGLSSQTRFVAIRNYMEQIPLPENRVTLSEKRDALGLPKAKIIWQISNQDKKTMISFHEIMQKEFQKLKIGELASPLLGKDLKDWPIRQDASHHMGTTRMGDAPASSVVDKNCKVHGVGNLFIAGSSVFPTGGYANPVATIVALAIRLADYVKTKYK